MGGGQGRAPPFPDIAWHAADFARSGGVVGTVARYSDPASRADAGRVRRTQDLDYDWDLNGTW